MRIRTTYPGQAVQEQEAPANMIRIIELFGGPPPFIEVLVDPPHDLIDTLFVYTPEQVPT